MKANKRIKDGKVHYYWTLVESVPTEETLREMRESHFHYLVGAPHGHLKAIGERLEKAEWVDVQPVIRVKSAHAVDENGKEGDLFVLPHSAARSLKETAMRAKKLCFAAFMALCLLATLRASTRARAPGLIPRQIIDKFKTLKMVDVILPTTDGRTITLPRHIEPQKDTALLLAQLALTLPAQPPPKVSPSPSLTPRMHMVV